MSDIFAVRGLPSSTLDGAFRVHLLPEHLDQLRLKVGDPCQLEDPDGNLLGHGISWRAAEKMGSAPKARPAKMTDRLRNAYGIKEGSQISITATNSRIEHAGKVTLTDVTPAEYILTNEGDQRVGNWLCNCAFTLSRLRSRPLFGSC